MPNIELPVPASRALRSAREESAHSARANAQVEALFQSYEYCNGLVLVPTLAALDAAGAFDRQLGSAPSPPERVADFAQRAVGLAWRSRFGRIWGAFNCLALQGWLELRGEDERTEFELTALGRQILTLAKADSTTLRLVLDARELLANLHSALRLVPPAADAVERYAGLVRRANDGWGLPSRAETVDTATHQWRSCLDGMLVCPTVVALSMPVYAGANGQLDAELPELLTWDAPSAAFDRAELGKRCAGSALLEPMLELLEGQGLLTSRLTTDVQAAAPERVALARQLVAGGALVGSYARTYARLEAHLFDPQAQLHIDADKHVDRLMNVFGTSRASSAPALDHLCKTYIARIFDRLPLAEQPIGIADMGCGDGRALRTLGEYVLNHTERGKHCREFPLLLLGADYNDAPLQRTRAELSCFDASEGISTHVVKADMTDPAGYDRAVRALCLGSPLRREPVALSDFLHSFMFIVHNRRLLLNSADDAEYELTRRLADGSARRAAARVLKKEFAIRLAPEASALAAAREIASLFPASYVRDGRAVPGCVVAADLVEFLRRWHPFAKHGFLSVEGHVPTGALLSALPTHPQPHVFRWGMHYISEQYLMSLREYLLATALAGFDPVGDDYGRIYPEGFPLNDDQSSKHRSRSVMHFYPRPNGTA
jgi:hypothetical protein